MDVHFNTDGVEMSSLVYIYREEDNNIKELKNVLEETKYAKMDKKFLKKIPSDLLELPAYSIIVLDDQEFELTRSKSLQSQLYSIASVLCRHKKWFFFLSCQSVSVLKKNHKINDSVQQASHICIFRNPLEHRSMSRYLNNLSIRLKGGMTLSQVYESYVQSRSFCYLLISVSPRCSKITAFSNIILSREGSMLSFHESSDDE